MSHPARITLTNGLLEAEIAPHLGARLCRLRTLDSNVDLIVPLGVWDAPEHSWPKAGAYPLIPYSNRIADAQLEFEGETYSLEPHPLDLPNTLHGHAQRCQWHTHEQNDHSVELALDAPASEHWPWRFEARIRFALRDAALVVDFKLRNTGTRPMPAGLGWHPFIALDNDSTIHFDARRHWELDTTFLPTGTSHSTTQTTTLTRADWLQAPCAIYASEWDGVAHIGRTEGVVRVTAAAPFTHLVAYTPRGGTFFCLEPVSHVANGFNFAARGIEGTGMRTLQPNETLTARTCLAWDAKR
jgi:aldose 1-epimerase